MNRPITSIFPLLGGPVTCYAVITPECTVKSDKITTSTGFGKAFQANAGQIKSVLQETGSNLAVT